VAHLSAVSAGWVVDKHLQDPCLSVLHGVGDNELLSMD